MVVIEGPVLRASPVRRSDCQDSTDAGSIMRHDHPDRRVRRRPADRRQRNIGGSRRRRRSGLAERGGDRAGAAPQGTRGVRRPGEGARAARDLHRRRQAARRGDGPRAPVRAARPRQDDAVAHHRGRARRQPAPDLGPGARKAQGPGGDPDQPREERRPLHRRDPSSLAGRRGDPLPCAGGLPDRHHDRRRAGSALDQARARAVHADRRDDARRHAHQPAARPLRHRHPARVLQRRRAGADRAPLGRPARRPAR